MPLTRDEIVASLRRIDRERETRAVRAPGGNTPPLTAYIAPPRADLRRVDETTREWQLWGLMRQADCAPIVTRTRGRKGQGERMLAPAPRTSCKLDSTVTIKFARFTRKGRLIKSSVETLGTLSQADARA